MHAAHEKVVEAQFGPRARAYVESAVHATGEDLDALEAVARELHPRRALDLGTGTGAIALALAHERPHWRITATDRSTQALLLANTNSQHLKLPVELLESDWFSALAGRRFELILSNPPYIDAADPHLGEGDLRFEPASALVAENQGLQDLYTIIAKAPEVLTPGGWLVLEHGWRQAEAVTERLTERGFRQVRWQADLGGQPRMSLGQWPEDSNEPS